jgi:hypothetical protein
MSDDFDLFSAMQEGAEPLARYRKTIVGKVHVVALNPFSEQPEGVYLREMMINLMLNCGMLNNLSSFKK